MPFFLFSVLVIGGSGFLSGFFLPLFLSPEANQGPLLGILITGPLGVVAGLLLGLILPLASKGRAKWKIVWGFAALIWAVMIFFCQPGPERVGVLYRGEITATVPASEGVAEAIQSWEEKAKAYQWHQPRAGWQEEMRAAIGAANGSIVTIQPAEAWEVGRERKFWNSGRYVLTSRSGSEPLRFYHPGQADAGNGYYMTTSIIPKDWPPREIANFLGVIEWIETPADLPLPSSDETR